MRKLGKLPPRVDARTLKLAKYLPVIPPPPPEQDWTAKMSFPCGQMLNDTLGDCAIAAPGHAIQTFTSNAGAELTIPDADILAAYRAVSGYDPADPSTDTGCVMLDALKYWRNVGIGGRKIGAYVSVDARNDDQVRFAIQHLQGVYVGLQLPLSAQNQDVWEYVPCSPGAWGGHAVWVPRYSAPAFAYWCITWGALKKMTNEFLHKKCDEMWAVVSQDMLDGAGHNPLGEHLDELNLDLAAL